MLCQSLVASNYSLFLLAACFRNSLCLSVAMELNMGPTTNTILSYSLILAILFLEMGLKFFVARVRFKFRGYNV